ncbi:formylmethanofuran dehydrogenase [Pseudodesulfovibrio sp. JC047]|uniref:FmdE family protein n=1 Tax=Pseudodesulfovibrio sp. JC047 TaxID=2683199 RepID=UPI0013D6557F|nr:FmdE family protein [Pseudodesulfovibrio sp. JC047]NDV19889.1 formylmethanofuran dehydrogenase [Pseudodesulfovibrio sp. JC047]
MPCELSSETIEQTVNFHGHTCPGLAIGIRAAELALQELGTSSDVDMVAVSETDMCGVDAIQFITSCTYGKGNFLHRDHGKMAFSFYDRNSGKGFRAVLNPEIRDTADNELAVLMRKADANTATPDEKKRITALRTLLRERFMTLDLHEMFTVMPPKEPIPTPARVLESLTCDCCHESVMESRTRRLGGQTLCIPCFTAREQKI